MAEIFNSFPLNEMVDKLGLAVGQDKISNSLNGNIVPTFSVNETGKIKYISLVGTGGSAGTYFNVPKGRKWEIIYGNIIYTSSATVGNRNVTFAIYDNTSAALRPWRVTVGINQPANSGYFYNLSNNATDVTTTTSGNYYIPIPLQCILLESFRLRVYEGNNVDAADTFSLNLIIKETSINA